MPYVVPPSMLRVEHAPGGGPDVMHLVQCPVPRPGHGEVLIRVAYAGVNRPDVLQRQGRYPPPPGSSPILGLEVAGTIVESGEGVTRHQVGDDVTALVPGGGYGRYCLAPAEHVLPIPRGLSLAQAAALPETHFTVWAMLFGQGRLGPGETVLIHGGTSGIGLTALELAMAWGSRVIVTVGSEEKARFCRERGVYLAIVRSQEDFVSVLTSMGLRPDVVLDIGGGPTMADNLRVLGRGGRLIQVGTLAGDQSTVSLSDILSKRLTITGSTMRGRTREEKALIARDLENKIWPLYEQGRLRAPDPVIYPIHAVGEAHRLMESGRHIGKIVLDLAPAGS